MRDYEETVRPGLARAMGWEVRWLMWGPHAGEAGETPGDPVPNSQEGRPPGSDKWTWVLPDPLNRADDAEALWTWCEEQGWEVDLQCRPEGHLVILRRCLIPRGEPCNILLGMRRWALIGEALVRATDEPDPAARRRRALVEAVWQAIRALPVEAP